MKFGRIEVDGSFLLAAALLYYFDQENIVPWALGSCLLHEMGHWIAVRLLGGKVVRLRLTCAGAELRLSSLRRLTPLEVVFAALAGPAVNLLLAFLLSRLARSGFHGNLYLFAGINLGMGCFNLLPVGWLDGGKILQALAALLSLEEWGDWMIRVCSIGSVFLLFLSGSLLLRHSGNFTLLVAAFWMAGAALQEDSFFSYFSKK